MSITSRTPLSVEQRANSYKLLNYQVFTVWLSGLHKEVEGSHPTELQGLVRRGCWINTLVNSASGHRSDFEPSCLTRT